jgi:hypothetical protein
MKAAEPLRMGVVRQATALGQNPSVRADGFSYGYLTTEYNKAGKKAERLSIGCKNDAWGESP